MEKARGVALGASWHQLSESSKRHFIDAVVEIERKSASIAFPLHGCLYYTANLPAKYRSEQLSPIPGDTANKFCLGPVVESRLWLHKRAQMDLPRGPCKNAYSICPHHC